MSTMYNINVIIIILDQCDVLILSYLKKKPRGTSDKMLDSLFQMLCVYL